MGDSLFIHRAAENLEMIGVVTIIRQHFSGGIAAGKHDREESVPPAPIAGRASPVCFLYSRAAGDLRREQQSKAAAQPG